jgi:4-carboxymuconolactone decarboxylase
MNKRITVKENAILGDNKLQEGLKKINPEWGDFCIRASAEAWGKPLIDQKTKTLLTLAVDIVIMAQGQQFANHVSMARQQGVTRAEMEELILFMSIYAGFNKAGVYYGALDAVYGAAE